MTNEEAINYLRGCFAPTCNICPIRCESADISQEARQIATQALEKQIPKKPVVFTSIEKSFRCPNCETEIMSIDKVNCQWGHEQLYCECCGQAIDWSKGND